MKRLAATGVAALVAGIVLAVLVAASPVAAQAGHYPTITASRYHVLHRDRVTLSGHTHSRYARIYRRLGYGSYHRIATVRVHSGRYHVVVRPVAGRYNRFKIGHGNSVGVRSTRCLPLSSPGGVSVWFEDRDRRTTLSDHWARLICSAAHGSTVSLAAMFIYDDGPSVDRIVSALRKVHRYRNVHVQVLVQHKGYHSGYRGTVLRRLLHFATLHTCPRGCHSHAIKSHMHVKFTMLSRTIFGRPALMETTANLSTRHLVGQRSSAVYFYDNRPLMDAYGREWRALVHRSPIEHAIWRGASRGIAYSFDPHSEQSDPVATELGTITCRRGDFVEVVNADISRHALVHVLDHLRSKGCAVRAVREFHTPQPRIEFPMRRIRLHDKFVLVDAHNSRGHVREVMTGSEDYRFKSMALSDQQLLRLRRSGVYWSYRYWFAHLWAIAGH